MKGLHIELQFTERAKAYLAHLPPGSLHFQAPVHQQPLLPGDKIRIAGIPNCPLFVISERVWLLSETPVLTLWLDEAAN